MLLLAPLVLALGVRAQEPALAPLAAKPSAESPAVDVRFEIDRRLELFSILEMLARPEEFRARLGDPLPGYAARAWKAFSPFAGHPAVARLRAMPESGRADVARAALGLGDPPEFAGAGLGSFAAFFAEAGAFAREARFARYYKDEAPARAVLVREAEAEAARGLRPDSLARYLRRPVPGEHRFVLAPLLPPALTSNVVLGSGPGAQYLRVRAADWSKPGRWCFSEFGSAPAHEIGHDVLDPLVETDPAALDATAGLFEPSCAPTWQACVIEQIDVAITLRALAAERGEATAAAMARFYEPKYAQLAALETRLREWEGARDGDFAAFYPRLLAVFSEARASAAAPAPPRRRPRP